MAGAVDRKLAIAQRSLQNSPSCCHDILPNSPDPPVSPAVQLRVLPMMRSGLTRTVLFSSLVMLAAAGGAAADQAQPKQAGGPCMADLARFCPEVPIGEGRRIACLAKHRSDLASACKSRLTVMEKVHAYGVEQVRRTKEYLAKQAAEEAKKKAAPPPAKKPPVAAPPPAAKPK